MTTSHMSPSEARAYYDRWKLPTTNAVLPRDTIDALNGAGLDEVERSYIATVVAVLTDPKMAGARRRLREGEIALSIEGDEVTWVDADQVADAIARDVRVDLAPETQDQVRRLIQEASAAGSVLTHVASRLERTIQSSGHRNSVDSVISIVSAEFGVSPVGIENKHRPGRVAAARHAVISLLGRQGVTDAALSELMGLDRSTLSCARQKVRRRLATDPEFTGMYTRAAALVAGTAPLKPIPGEAP